MGSCAANVDAANYPLIPQKRPRIDDADEDSEEDDDMDPGIVFLFNRGDFHPLLRLPSSPWPQGQTSRDNFLRGIDSLVMNHCCRDVRVIDSGGQEVVGLYQGMKVDELSRVQQSLNILNG